MEFNRDKIGDMDTELFREWFQAFAMASGTTLHVETLYGMNNHHIAESCFKGLARALKAAGGARFPTGGQGTLDQGHLIRIARRRTVLMASA